MADTGAPFNLQRYEAGVPDNLLVDGNKRFQDINDKAMAKSVYDPNGTAEIYGDISATSEIADRIYTGVNLAVKFASEIAAAPYNGDAWAWVRARIQAAYYAGIHVGDYLPLTCTNGYQFRMEANIDTYYNYGDTPVGHHIDFISLENWPETHVWNKANYNNGTTVSPNPWLACDLYAWLNSLAMNVPNAATANPTLVAVNYTTTGVYDKLPTEVKNVIIQKRAIIPRRYAVGTLVTDDIGWDWANIGKLWLPSEVEVYGMEHWGSKNGNSGAGYQQYPIFANNMSRVKFYSGIDARTLWWLTGAYGGNSGNITTVGSEGYGYYSAATATGRTVPLCFRVG